MTVSGGSMPDRAAGPDEVEIPISPGGWVAGDVTAYLIGGPHHDKSIDLPPSHAADLLTFGDDLYRLHHKHRGGEWFYVYDEPPAEDDT